MESSSATLRACERKPVSACCPARPVKVVPLRTATFVSAGFVAGRSEPSPVPPVAGSLGGGAARLGAGGVSSPPSWEMTNAPPPRISTAMPTSSATVPAERPSRGGFAARRGGGPPGRLPPRPAAGTADGCDWRSGTGAGRGVAPTRWAGVARGTAAGTSPGRAAAAGSRSGTSSAEDGGAPEPVATAASADGGGAVPAPVAIAASADGGGAAAGPASASVARPASAPVAGSAPPPAGAAPAPAAGAPAAAAAVVAAAGASAGSVLGAPAAASTAAPGPDVPAGCSSPAGCAVAASPSPVAGSAGSSRSPGGAAPLAAPAAPVAGADGTFPLASASTASASSVACAPAAVCAAGGAGISARRRGGAIPPCDWGIDGARRVAVAVASATTRCSSSRARSGARPAHSRRRLSSRACEKYSSDSTARPKKAAMPTYTPYFSTWPWKESASRTMCNEPLILGAVPAGTRLQRNHRAGIERRRHLAHGGQLTHLHRQGGGVAVEHEPSDLVERLLLPGRIEARMLGPEDLLRRRRLRPLVRVEQLLVQLLARPRADHLDRDVALGLQSGEPDHVVRQLHDPHRLAHLEHEDLAALHERARPDHELDRLGDRHEVARHLAVRDRERAAGGDLAPEDRHDRARGAEHVAEAHGAEGRLREALVGRLDGPFRERLGGAHHGGRRDRLVGRDEHEGEAP